MHKRIAAALARVVESCFSTIDPFGNSILVFVSRTRRSFGHNSTYR